MLTSLFLTDLDLCSVRCWHHFRLISISVLMLTSFTSDHSGINVPGCLLGGIRRGWEQWQRNQWTLYAPPKWGCHNNNGCIIIQNMTLQQHKQHLHQISSTCLYISPCHETTQSKSMYQWFPSFDCVLVGIEEDIHYRSFTVRKSEKITRCDVIWTGDSK